MGHKNSSDLSLFLHGIRGLGKLKIWLYLRQVLGGFPCKINSCLDKSEEQLLKLTWKLTGIRFTISFIKFFHQLVSSINNLHYVALII